MALKSIRFILAPILLCFVLFTAFFPIDSAQAFDGVSNTEALPLLSIFVSQLKNGQADQVRGVYVPEILAASVVQQPEGHNEFVSTRQNTVTQFGLASQFGSTGLLAHNDLAGASFSHLKIGQKIYLIYGNGQVSTFVVAEILRYQALNPNSITSTFVELDTRDLLKASEVFSKVYNRPGQMVFQTCISKGDELSWGRLFVVAKPYPHKS